MNARTASGHRRKPAPLAHLPVPSGPADGPACAAHPPLTSEPPLAGAAYAPLTSESPLVAEAPLTSEPLT
ncbi:MULTISPECIES: hypothetical protein [Streptomyces]|uniref:hypothetical protein n=1 Tax=Streptomyces TaxID=1883 RepID=UPI000F6BBA7B|nr:MULTISPECIES: hypothetical protein [unclassified Streptomyces]AZM89198.1 hypothetical protein D1J60_12445 [Streptomyces sp. W1SF4]RSS39545.1 hypothetical protein EF912_33100 [Streptomyces sp. WAC07061]